MKKAKVTFIPIDGTGALHLDFEPGPFGAAIEATKGEGVGFFNPKGALQGVTFDDVDEKQEHQILEFEHCRIEITIKNGKIAYSVIPMDMIKKAL